MLKKFLKPFIIGSIQVLLLLILIAWFVPFLLKNTDSVNQLKHLLHHYQEYFLIAHSLFYVALYFLWPSFIQYMVQKQTTSPTEGQLKKAFNARFYLIGLFILFELLRFIG